MKTGINAFYEGSEGEECETSLTFGDDIFSLLPPLFKEITEKFETKQEKDAALITSIGAISGLCTNYTSLYDKRTIEPNLYVFLLSTFGEGKGVMGFIKKLIEPSDRFIETCYKDKQKRWLDNEQKGIKPKRKILIIPSDTTKIQFLKLLSENEGRAVLFESEADTLTTALQSKHGGFGDILRNGFQGEASSFTRATDDVLEKIDKTRLAVVVSGTENQVRRLIKDYEDGLASRFDFYRLAGNPEFKKVLSDQDDSFEKWFEEKGEQLLSFYQLLKSKTINPVSFTWFAEGQQEFEQYWEKQKKYVFEKYEGRYNGLINRQALKCAKMAMVLTIVRAFNNEETLPEKLVCCAEDVYTVLSLSNTLLENNILVAETIKQRSSSDSYIEARKQDIALKEQVFSMWDSGITNGAEIGRVVKKNRATIFRWLANSGRK